MMEPAREELSSDDMAAVRALPQGSALLIMGIAGGALIPQLFVHLKDALGFQLVFLLLVAPCYLYILYFATRGHRAGQR